MVPTVIMLTRFMLAFLLASFFGLERQRLHKPIGFGTFIFVASGSCALSITALVLDPQNPLPLLGATVTGIGFLGAGALIKTTDKIFGFTSAATIWLFAIFGLLIGVGEYFLGCLLYIAAWIVTFFNSYLEKHGVGSFQRKIVIQTKVMIDTRDIEPFLGSGHPKLVSFEVDKKNEKAAFTYLLEGSKGKINRILAIISKKEWFYSFKME